MIRVLLVLIGIFAAFLNAQAVQTSCSFDSAVIPGVEAEISCTIAPSSSNIGSTISITLTVAQPQNAIFPNSSVTGQGQITLVYNYGDTVRSAIFIPYAAEVSGSYPPVVGNVVGLGNITITATDPSNNNYVFSTLVGKRNLDVISQSGAVNSNYQIRLGDFPKFTIRLRENLPYSAVGQTTTGGTLQINMVSQGPLSLTFNPSSLTFGQTDVAKSFVITAGPLNTYSAINTSATIYFTVTGTGSLFYNPLFNMSVICVAANFVPNAVVPFSNAGFSTVIGMETAPLYLFIDTPFDLSSLPLPPGSQDLTIRTTGSSSLSWNFQDPGPVLYQRFYATPLFPSNHVIKLYPSGPGYVSVPTTLLEIFSGTSGQPQFPVTLDLTSTKRDFYYSPSGSITLQIGDYINVGVQLRQPLPTGSYLDIYVDCPGLLFSDPTAGFVTTQKMRITAGQTTGATIRAYAAYTGNFNLNFEMDPLSPAVYLFNRVPRTTSVFINKPAVVIDDGALKAYTGVVTQTYRVYVTRSPYTLLSVIPYSAHCVSNPFRIDFTPSSATFARFTLQCLNTIEPARYTVAPDNQLYVFLAGTDRSNFTGDGASFTIGSLSGLARASVSLYSDPSTPIYIQNAHPYSIYTNRPPDSSLVVNLHATQGATVSPSSVTLTPTNPNAVVYLTSPFPAIGILGMTLSGPDAQNYIVPSAIPWISSSRPVAVARVCTQAETELNPPTCTGLPNSIFQSTSPFTLNAPDVFLTYFNITIPLPATNGLTINLINPNLQFYPNPVVIAAGSTTEQFSVTTTVGGTHEIYFSYSGSTPDSLIHTLPRDSSSLAVTVTQSKVARTVVSFPTASAIQNVVPIALISFVILLITVLF